MRMKRGDWVSAMYRWLCIGGEEEYGKGVMATSKNYSRTREVKSSREEL